MAHNGIMEHKDASWNMMAARALLRCCVRAAVVQLRCCLGPACWVLCACCLGAAGMLLGCRLLT
eukprot:5836470-Lingulodinium_polyedra.AAC.1